MSSIDESHVKFEVDKPTTFLVNLIEPMKYALVSWDILSKMMISNLYENFFGADKKWLAKRDKFFACDRLLAHFACFFQDTIFFSSFEPCSRFRDLRKCFGHWTEFFFSKNVFFF